MSRPFRAPHHSITAAGLVGGASRGSVGEVVLAHNGVLFLDELSEFSRPTLEALRQPLEDGRVAIARARHSAVYPARFMLLAATNPCPCGYAGEGDRCGCSEADWRAIAAASAARCSTASTCCRACTESDRRSARTGADELRAGARAGRARPCAQASDGWRRRGCWSTRTWTGACCAGT